MDLAAEIGCGPVAIVASGDVEYGMARMYMALTELKHPNTMVFRCYEKALNWLGEQSKISYHPSEKRRIANPDL